MSNKSSATPPVVFTLDPDRLQPGDILLTRAPSALGSATIRAVTRSRFSHAALYVRDGLFIEAVGQGVCRFAIGATGARLEGNIRLLRLSEDVFPDAAARAEAAAKQAEGYLSRGYSKAGAVGVVFTPLRNSARVAMFCSQLIVRAYAKADTDLLPGRAPEGVAPGDLLKSTMLRDVTGKALVRLVGGAAPPYFLDDDRQIERPHHREIITKLRVLQSRPVREALSRLGEQPATFHELEEVLARRRDRGLDAAVLRQLETRRLAETYFTGLAAFVDLDGFEADTRELQALLDAGGLVDADLLGAIKHGLDLYRPLDADVADRRRWTDLYEAGQLQHGLSTFGHLALIQRTALAGSVEALNAVIRRLNILVPEAERRGLNPVWSAFLAEAIASRRRRP